MVTSITLGKVSSFDNQFRLTGAASGIDSEAIIEGLVDARRLPATILEDEIETNTNKLTAYSEMETVLTDLQTAADLLRDSSSSFLNNTTDIYSSRSADLTTSLTGESPEEYIAVTVESGATIGTYTLTGTGLNPIQLAQSEQQSVSFSSADNGITDYTTEEIVSNAADGTNKLLAEGTLTVNNSTDLGGTTDITLSDGDTIYDVAAKFNTVSDQTGFNAFVMKNSDTQYSLIFTANNSGTNFDFDLTSTETGVGEVFEHATVSQVTAAQDAQFDLNGLSITRSTNTVTDAVNGVTIDLLKATSAASDSITISVEEDNTQIADAIINFADAYNNFMVFNAEQNLRNEDGSFAEESYLGGDATLRTVLDTLADEVSSIVSGISSMDPASLADIGITFQDYEGDSEIPPTENIMVVDSNALNAAIAADVDEVRRVLGVDFTSDDVNLSLLSHTNELDINSFQIRVKSGAGVIQAEIDYGSGFQPITTVDNYYDSGSNLIGAQLEIPDTAPFDGSTGVEGLQFLYDADPGASWQTINVSITQGIADRIYNVVEDYLDEDDGLVTVAVEGLTEENTQKQDDIDDIDDQIETYRQSLIQQYAALEQAISSANSILQLIDAQNSARNNG